MKAGDVIRAARERMKLSQADLGRMVGISQVAVRKIEAGSTVRSKYLPRIVAVLGLELADFDEFLGARLAIQEHIDRTGHHPFGEGLAALGKSGTPVVDPEGKVVGLVPLVGYVGAGSKAHIYDVPEQYLGDVPAIDGATDKTVAVEIRGDSLGEVFNNWLAYYDDVRRPVTSDLHRKLCVVGLADDRIFIKKLHPTPTPGIYDLISEKKDETIEGVHVKWAAKVKAMTPR
jgi:transcriptional regulator with XRE-family HTH domain